MRHPIYGYQMLLMLASVVVARSEGYDLVPASAPDFSTEAATEALEHGHQVA